MAEKSKIKEIVAEVLEIEVDQLDDDADFVEDLGMDSLRALEILANLENQFNITIEPDKLTEMRSLNKVVKIVEELGL